MKKTILGFSTCAFAMAAFGLSACSDETTNVVEQTGMQIVTAGEKLDKCTEKNAGEMIFVTDSSAVFYCADGKWLTLNGKDGQDGANGKDGADGEDGKPGTATEGKPGTSCSVKDVANGVEVRCGDKVSVVTNGESIKGEDGKGCTAADTVSADGTAGYNLNCADKRVGTIWSGKDGEDGKDLVAVYDTMTTEFLNQEMLAEGKYGFLVDKRDNKVYRTIEIGTQTWMAQNLNYSDGGVTSYCFDNDLEKCKQRGRLYRWAAAMNLEDMYNGQRASKKTIPVDSILRYPVYGICPEGWHVPDSTEWRTLDKFVSASNKSNYNGIGVGTTLKSTHADGWKTEISHDEYGFSAMPFGMIMGHGNMGYDGVSVDFWTSNEMNTTEALYITLHSTDELHFYEMTPSGLSKTNPKYIRCIKNSD